MTERIDLLIELGTFFAFIGIITTVALIAELIYCAIYGDTK